MTAFSGMICVEGISYRIHRVEPDGYEIVRIHDDAWMGTFRNGASLAIDAPTGDAELVRRLACAAIQGGKVAWLPESSRPKDRHARSRVLHALATVTAHFGVAALRTNRERT